MRDGKARGHRNCSFSIVAGTREIASPAGIHPTVGAFILENRGILTGIGTVLFLVAVLSFGVYLERSGLEDLGIVRTGFAQSHIAKHTPGVNPDVQNNRVYRKKLRSQKIPKEWKDFEDLEQDMMRFCRYLDGREYIKTHKLPEGTFRHFVKILNDLAAYPPIVNGEATDPYKLKLNQEHFLRVIGRENNKGIEAKSPEIRMTQKELYEYAAFFLTTLSGKAYLWRRDSKTRILATYYSVLIVDRANLEKANRFNVDIKPPVAQLMDDLINYRNLSYRGLYIKKLKALEAPASAG
jgi:hypothetical protein